MSWLAWFALSAAVQAAVVQEDFSSSRIAPKPASAILFDAKSAPRRIQNPSIIEGRDGALIAAWSSKGLTGDNHPSDFIQASTSIDGGSTWSNPVTAAPASSINPTFLRAANGDVLLFYNRNHTTLQDDTGICFRRSRDNGRTWSEDTWVETGYRIGIIVHNGIVMRNGEWLIAFQNDRSNQGEPFLVRRTEFVSAVAISKDEGKSWTVHGALRIPNLVRFPNTGSWGVEAAVAERKDGSLLMLLRSRAGWIYRSVSTDQGRTWSEPAPTQFSNPDSKISLHALADGNLVLLWNDSRVLGTRYPLLASLSNDGGATWPYSVTLDDDNAQLDYPSIVESRDELKIVYGHSLKQVRLIALREADLKQRWTAINGRDSWIVSDGALHVEDRGTVENASDWLRWSRLFTSEIAPGSTIEIDLRFDGEQEPSGGAIAVFPFYQDEANWTAWVCQPSEGKLGFEQEEHFGTAKLGNYSRQLSATYFESFRPEPFRWYTVRIQREDSALHWELRDRGNPRVLIEARNPIRAEGNFLALGARNVKASFDNLRVYGGPKSTKASQ
ncbi:MAG: glycoside hydrolase [Acidobacteriota bacterium]|nr:glycoside hydrolase [Acidobacteriota bacterium]